MYFNHFHTNLDDSRSIPLLQHTGHLHQGPGQLGDVHRLAPTYR